MNQQTELPNINPLKLILQWPVDEEILAEDQNSIILGSDLLQFLCPYIKLNDKNVATILSSCRPAIEFIQSLISELETFMAHSPGCPSPEDYLNFLGQILQASSQGSQKKIFPILRDNADNLDINFAQILQLWTSKVLPLLDESQARKIGAQIANLSSLIGEISLGNKLINVEIYIAGYESISNIFTREDYPQQWATIQNNLGNGYSDRIQGEKPENLEIAIACYQRALLVRTRESSPQEWAATQNNLGRALCNRVYGDKAENLEMALACYQSALQVYNRRSFPKEWATTQNNLANAYSDRMRGQRADNLESAIECYKKALEIRTAENSPQQWAKTQVNLGRVLCDRLLGNKADNLKQAISCYQSAVKYYRKDRATERWATVQIYLGHTHSKYAQQIMADFAHDPEIKKYQEESAYSLSEAIICYQNALRVCPKFSERWTIIQIHLANIYSDKLLGGDRSANLKAAITCYQNSCQVYTENVYPDRWAKLQLQMANAYRQLGDDLENNLDQAIICYQNALLVYNHNSLPQYYAKTLFNIGTVYQQKGGLYQAYEAYAKAIDTVEFNRGQMIGDPELKSKLSQIWISLYESMIRVCLALAKSQPENIEYYARTLEYLERNKARKLVEFFANCQLQPKAEATSDIIFELVKIRRAIEAEQHKLDDTDTDELNRYLMSVGKFQTQGSFLSSLTSDYQQLNQFREQFDQLIESKIEEIDPYFKIAHQVRTLNFTQIQELLPDRQTVILEFANIGDTLLAFVIESESSQPIILEYDQEKAMELQAWIVDYLNAYTEQRARWVNQLGNRLDKLAEIIEIDRLVSAIPERCDRLIIIPDGYLHLVALHALPLNVKKNHENGAISYQPFTPNTQYLIDRFPRGVRYAPSALLLQTSQIFDRSMRTVSATPPRYLFAIASSSQDGFYSNLEIGNMRRHFSTVKTIEDNITKEAFYQSIDPETDTGTGVTAATFNVLMQLGNCTHFSCQGSLNLSSPIESGLILGDTPLQITEIANIDWRQCRLATLSGCEMSGLVDHNKKLEEYIGLPSVFLYGGVASVVSSLWRVSDISTLLLINKFYDTLMKMPRLKPGDVAISLNKAQKWLRELTTEDLEIILEKMQPQITKTFAQLPTTKRLLAQASLQQVRNRKPCPFAHPYHWAGFIITGL